MGILHNVQSLLLGMAVTFHPAQASEWEIRLPVHASIAQCLSPDGTTLMMGDTFGPVLCFDAASGTFKTSWDAPSKRLYSLTWMPNGKDVALGDPDAREATAVVLRSSSRRPKRLPGGVHALAPSPSGRFLASLDRDTLCLADLRSGKRLRWFEPPFKTWRLAISEVRLLAWLPGDQLLAVRGGWGVGVPFEILRLDVPGERTLSPIPLPQETVACALALDAEQHLVYLGTDDGQLIKVNLEQGRVDSVQKPGRERIAALALDGQRRLARWQGDQIHITGPEGGELGALPAFVCYDSHGWRPVLAWSESDLILASKDSRGVWRAERKAFILSAPPSSPLPK
jgi:WD40 repeat protein